MGNSCADVYASLRKVHKKTHGEMCASDHQFHIKLSHFGTLSRQQSNVDTEHRKPKNSKIYEYLCLVKEKNIILKLAQYCRKHRQTSMKINHRNELTKYSHSIDLCTCEHKHQK